MCGEKRFLLRPEINRIAGTNFFHASLQTSKILELADKESETTRGFEPRICPDSDCAGRSTPVPNLSYKITAAIPGPIPVSREAFPKSWAKSQRFESSALMGARPAFPAERPPPRSNQLAPRSRIAMCTHHLERDGDPVVSKLPGCSIRRRHD